MEEKRRTGRTTTQLQHCVNYMRTCRVDVAYVVNSHFSLSYLDDILFSFEYQPFKRSRGRTGSCYFYRDEHTLSILRIDSVGHLYPKVQGTTEKIFFDHSWKGTSTLEDLIAFGFIEHRIGGASL